MDIVFPDKWILNRAGKELEGLEGKGTYFINYPLYDEKKPRPHGAFFTHLESKWQKRFDEVAGEVDYAVCLNDKIKKYLEDKGVPRVEIIQHGHDPRIKKDIMFGVVGRVYSSGRKGEHLVRKMVDSGYDVISLGEGWPCEKYGDWEVAPDFYKLIDYLVVTSLEEGGPVPVIDSISAGVPVIAPDVGWCWEFPVIRYKRGDWSSLRDTLNKLTKVQTWQDWRRQHQFLFSSMK